MAGGSFASDPSFDAYNQQVNPAMASYFQTMGQLERSRGRLMEVSQGVMGAVPGAMQMAQSGLGRMGGGMMYAGAGASAFHSRFLGAYNRYQGPMTGQYDVMGPGTAIAGLMGAQPFIQGRFQYEGGHIARDVALQNFNIAAQDAIRTGLTQVAPQAIMMGGFMMGGPYGAALAGVGAAASLAAPYALRAYGIDAQLHSERFRRQIQLTVGERLGDRGGADRFRLSRQAAGGAAAAVTDYVSNIQQQYGWFAPEAREFEPLVQAAIATTSDKDLPKILEAGAKGLKDRISALREAAAVLNMNFEEISQLAVEFGEDSELGVGGRFDQFVQDINRAATRGRGLNRRALAQAAIQARDQAISQGFQGEATQRGLVSLAADIQQRANRGLIERDYLFAFGGRTQAEAAINTAMATQQMERGMAQGPFGMMALSRMMGGGGIQGGLLGGAGQLGQTFAQNPFGFMLAQYSPQNLTRMGQEAPYQLFSRMQQTFGGGQFGQLAFLRTLQQQTGMNNAQAMAQYRRIRGERAMLAEAFQGTNLSQDQLMNAFLSARSMAPDLTIGEFAGGGFTTAQVEALAAGDDRAALYMGSMGIGPAVPQELRTDAQIAELVNARETLRSDERWQASRRQVAGVMGDITGGDSDSLWGWDNVDTALALAAIPTGGISLGLMGARRGVALMGEAGAALYAGGRDWIEIFTGEAAERTTRERQALMAERRAKKESLGAFTGYEGTNRFLEANMERLKALGIVNEVAEAAGAGTTNKFLFGLFRRGSTADRMRETIRTQLAGQDPAKAQAMQALFQGIQLGGEIEGIHTLRMAKGADAGQLAEALMSLSPEDLAMGLTALGEQGMLRDYGALEKAFQEGATERPEITIEELKGRNVKEQLKLLTRNMLSPKTMEAAAAQNRFFGAFMGGSLAQTIVSANAAIQQNAFNKLANLQTDGNTLVVKQHTAVS